MKPILLEQIIQKACSECRVLGVCLYNWGEPLLHPELPRLISTVQSHGVPCFISSNLNISRNIEPVMDARPHTIFVSVSGFTQSTYGVTHRGGDIESVKRNMAALAEFKRRTGSTTRIQVRYHLYLNNLQEAVDMKRFALGLGLEFQASWAYMMPIEKLLTHLGNHQDEAELTDEDVRLIKRLALPLEEASKACQGHKTEACWLRDDQMTLDHMGNVYLCCGVYNVQKYTLVPYLSASVADIQKMKRASSMCVRCMAKGLHAYCIYGCPELDNLAITNIIRHKARPPDEVLNLEILMPTGPGLCAPAPLSPVDGATVTAETPALSWTPVTGASFYMPEIRQGLTLIWRDWPAATCVKVPSGRLLPGSAYDWRVYAGNGGVYGPASPLRSFTVGSAKGSPVEKRTAGPGL